MWWISPEFHILSIHLLTTYNHHKSGNSSEIRLKIQFQFKIQFPSSAPYLPVLTSLFSITQGEKKKKKEDAGKGANNGDENCLSISQSQTL